MPITVEKTCLYCNNTFTVTVKYPSREPKNFCTPSCRVKYYLPLQNKHPWSERETVILSELIDSCSRRMLAKKYNKIAVKFGYPKRSSNAIYFRILQLRSSDRELLKDHGGVYDNWTKK
ncbi:MAG: hypothetical protein ACRC32_28310, partial [Chroococcidiopsis sp.]